jgi:hypothetical protein
MTNIATRYFTQLSKYSLIVCNECCCAVWPHEVDAHLGGKHHSVKKEERKLVQEAIHLFWPGLITNPTQLIVPPKIEEPIPELSSHNGFVCQLEPEKCQGVYCKRRSIIQHWAGHHKWNMTGKNRRGGLSRAQKKVAEEQFEEACKKVQCQRFFVNGHCSQYFSIAQQQAPAPKSEGLSLWEQIKQEVNAKFELIQHEAKKTIQGGEKDEVNVWLERTRWESYLKGYNREELLAAVEKPDSNPGKEEQFEEIVWKTMTEVAMTSQETVSKSGVFVRMEAIRTEEHQTRYTPLETYWDSESLDRRAQPWRQVLMFFMRSRGNPDWRVPPFKFTRAQMRAFKSLVKEVDLIIEEEEESRGEEASEEEDCIGMTPVKVACLNFCIALLNQEIQYNEYESALVCALAVLGVNERGWREADSYPPILSNVIKCARFMVIQKAVNIAGSPEDKGFSGVDAMDFDSDGRYGSDICSNPPGNPLQSQQMRTSTSSPARQANPRVWSCLKWVEKMMSTFMVRGSKSPMQWMLDLRTYGLKIHFNTTSRGHVEWCNGDELLYKSAQFRMAQFRAMVHGLVFEAQGVMREELLFCGGNRQGEMPAIDWNLLRDNPTDSRPGWNFLQDQRTRLPVDGKDWVFDQIGSQVDVRRRFERSTSESGIERHMVEKYMMNVTRFQEKMLVLMHIAGGQPARGTELLSIRHSNTEKGGHRNIFIEDGMVVFVTQYHKGYAMSGDVKIIHRYLPREIGQLLVLYLWLVLPFQQRMQAVVYHEDAMSSHMWPKDAGGKNWTSDRMSKAMKNATMIGLGHALTIRDYREVAIGISRKFMRGTTTFQEDEGESKEEDDISDEQAGHGSHVAGMVYARGIMEMAGVVMSKRRQFRTSSTDWHQFLGFASAMEEVKQKGGKRKCPFELDATRGDSNGGSGCGASMQYRSSRGW